MREPLIIELRPSRAILASVLVAHLAAALALFHVPAFGDGSVAALAIGGWGLLALSLLRSLVGELGKRGMRLVFEDDGHVEVALPGRGPPLGCRVQAGTAVDLQWGIWLGLEPAGAAPSSLTPGRIRRLMLVRSNLHRPDRQSWRELKIWLRHRSGRASGSVPTLT